jgi:hypothetical protein
MYPTLETLDMTPEQLAAAREAICRRAYQNWLDAGQPCGADVDCWLKAEQQWIAQDYVPPRPLDGERPAQPTRQPCEYQTQPPVTDAVLA